MFLEPMMASTTPDNKRKTLSSATGYVLEPKHDGMRAVISKHDGEVKIYSRVGLSYEGHLPALVAELAKLPDGTILDGELMVVKSFATLGDLGGVPVADFNATMRIMGSNPDKAVARQTENSVIEFCAFDIPKFAGESLEDQPYWDRALTLSNVLIDLDAPHVFKNPALTEWDDSTIDTLWEAGIEGAILKNKDSLYLAGKRRSNNWYKIKAELTADVVLMGFTDAKEGKTGKWLGKIGALVFGAYDRSGNLVEVGQCSGMTDAERDAWTDVRKSGTPLDYVIEVKYNDLVGSGEYGTPRHPQYKTVRADKRPEDCTMEQFKQ
jgi:bifunctional non-homologous end joining protein LigD